MKLKRKHKNLIKLLISIIVTEQDGITDGAWNFSISDNTNYELVGVCISYCDDGSCRYGVKVIIDDYEMTHYIDLITKLDKKEYRLLIKWLISNIDKNEHIKNIFNKELR